VKEFATNTSGLIGEGESLHGDGLGVNGCGCENDLQQGSYQVDKHVMTWVVGGCVGLFRTSTWL